MAIHSAWLALQAGEGETVTLGGSRFTFKATSEGTGGAYALLEYVAPPGAGAPPHFHTREDEAFYILEGTMTFQLGEERVEAAPGAYVFIPRHLRHAFANQGSAPVRALVLLTPGGLERYFQKSAALLEAAITDPAAFAALNERYGLHFE